MKKKNLKEKISALSRDKRFLHGSFSVALTAMVIVCVIALNILFSALSAHFNWYADMTPDEVYSITEESVQAIQNVQGVKYKILFCQEADRVRSSQLGLYVYQCAQTYAERTDKVEVEYLDLSEPSAYAAYSKTTSLTKDSVIIASFDAQSGDLIAFRALTYLGFYVADSDVTDSTDIFAFDGEYRFTATMLGLATGRPYAYFTDGHGEENTEDNALYNLFVDAGYEVRILDLKKAKLPLDASEEATLKQDAEKWQAYLDDQNQLQRNGVIIINNPKKDFYAYKEQNEDGSIAVNETSFVERYVREYDGNLMLFADPTANQLPKLQDLASTYQMNFDTTTGAYLTDTGSSLSQDGKVLLATQNQDAVVKNLLGEKMSTLRAVTPYATKLRIPDETVNEDGGYTLAPDGMSGTFFPLLRSGADDSMTLGMFAINHIKTGGERYHTYVMVCGSPGFASDAYLGSNAYANRDILYTVLFRMKNQKNEYVIPSDLNYRLLADESLDITTHAANVWTAVIVTVLPLCVTVAGIVVYVRRKHL